MVLLVYDEILEWPLRLNKKENSEYNKVESIEKVKHWINYYLFQCDILPIYV